VQRDPAGLGRIDLFSHGFRPFFLGGATIDIKVEIESVATWRPRARSKHFG
jgi:hypothetical protein